MGSHASSELSAEDRARLVHSGAAGVDDAPAPAATPHVSAIVEKPSEEPAIAPIWLQRASLAMLVLFCLYLGGLVAYLPWWPRMWDHNLFINSHPTLAAVLHNGAVRGVISGLGLLDIWIGISEAVHYRDHRP